MVLYTHTQAWTYLNTILMFFRILLRCYCVYVTLTSSTFLRCQSHLVWLSSLRWWERCSGQQRATVSVFVCLKLKFCWELEKNYNSLYGLLKQTIKGKNGFHFLSDLKIRDGSIYHFFMSSTDTATWSICRYQCQSDNFFSSPSRCRLLLLRR